MYKLLKLPVELYINLIDFIFFTVTEWKIVVYFVYKTSYKQSLSCVTLVYLWHLRGPLKHLTWYSIESQLIDQTGCGLVG